MSGNLFIFVPRRHHGHGEFFYAQRMKIILYSAKIPQNSLIKGGYMPLFKFALEDWYRLPIGGKYECYVRPDRPYTIIIDNEHNKVALTLEISSNPNWYVEEFTKQVEADMVLPLNQHNLYFLEREALLAEERLNIHHDHFYEDVGELEEKRYLYAAIFEVFLFDRPPGYLGLRSQQEYLLVYNSIPYLSFDPNSLEYQKSLNIFTAFTGATVCRVVDVTDSIISGI